MEIGNIIPHIEALIFASEKPLTSMEITELINNAFGFMEEKLTLEQIQTSLDGIVEKYASEFYPFEVRESGGGWQFLTKKDYHKTVAQLNGEKFLKRLSSAALETLAIIAYKQPITKGEIEAIRGVSSDYSIQKLLEKELIVITGRNEDMPGKPLVYSTSKTFMDYFGINSPADLPKLKEVFADTLVEPTVITHSPGETLPEEGGSPGETSPAESGGAGSDGQGTPPEGASLVVSEQGELVEGATLEESDETPDTDASAVESALEAGRELHESDSEDNSSESDEEGDDDSDKEANDGQVHDGGSDESHEDGGEDDYSDDSGEQPPHDPASDVTDEH
ncbi:MAG: SMC-Scp complex subunit ScpB [Bacteroidetes bacterium]|nr:SMC-Scp complex subunit ScpB [Bacteroidota bacterium]